MVYMIYVSILCSFDMFLCVGGYWSGDDAYLSGEAHEAGRHIGEGFSLQYGSAGNYDSPRKP